MKIAVVGTGYVGLVSGVCFSDFGHEVVCVDRYAEKSARLKAGEVPIYESGLDEMIAKNAQAGWLSFSTELDGAHAANAFLATKVTFINEMAALCEKVGADIKQVSKGMSLGGRIGNKFLHAGPCFGGSCFPKDTCALARTGQEDDSPLQKTETVIAVNEQVKRRMIDKLLDICDGSFAGKTVAVFGVTFKPNTDDMREAPALTIVPALLGGGVKVRSLGPSRGRSAATTLRESGRRCMHGYPHADLVVIRTEWNEFRGLDLEKLAKHMNTPNMVGQRNVYSSRGARSAEFEAYEGVGCGRVFS